MNANKGVKMDQYGELMSRKSKLVEAWMGLDPQARGLVSVGVVLGKGGQLRMPVKAINSGEYLYDLEIGPGEVQVTRCWGPGPAERELV